MVEQIPEVWEATFQGVKIYGAYGPRDVLIFKSSESLQGPEVVKRREGHLTQEDKDRLSSEGIPSECWSNDAQIMRTRFRNEGECCIVEDDPNMTVSYVMEKITSFLKSTKMPGVIITYSGPGRKGKGDWCFKDGFISFQDLMALYEKHFIGKSLSIISDCSYSGKWVELLMNYLDDCQIPPCAHYSKVFGKLLAVIASCRSNEIPHTLYFSARTCRNDKNTGKFYTCNVGYSQTAENQHSCRCQNSDLTCGAKDFDCTCQMSPTYTWQKMHRARRLWFIRNRTEWALVLLVDDDDVIDSIKEGKLSPVEFGEIIKSGNGNEPPAQVKEMINREYWGHRCF